MGVMNIGMSSVNWNTVSNTDAGIYAKSGTRKVYLVWHTYEGSDIHESFTVSVRYRGYKKGERQSSLSWSNWFTETLPVSMCNDNTSDYASGHYWAIGFSQLGNLFSQLTNDSTDDDFSFDKRIFDCIQMEVSIGVKMREPAEWNGWSDVIAPEYANLTLYYVPEYTFTKIYYEEPELVVVEYDDGGWTREDDRYGIDGIKSTAGQWWAMPNLMTTDDYWGVVPKAGRIEIPTSMLRQHIKGMSVRVKIRFVASFRPSGSNFGGFSEIGTVKDETICNTPTISLTTGSNPNYVYITVGDSNDKGAPMESCSIKLSNGKYSADEVVVEKVGSTFPTAVFKYPPFNKTMEFIALGGKGKAVSDPRYLSVPAKKSANETILDVIDDEEEFQLKLKYNPSFSISGGPSKEIYKLADRRRSSAFYGTGGENTVSLQAEILDDSGDSFLALQDIPNDVMVRMPDGKRFAISVDSVSLDWDNRLFKTVSIEGTEVDA